MTVKFRIAKAATDVIAPPRCVVWRGELNIELVSANDASPVSFLGRAYRAQELPKLFTDFCRGFVLDPVAYIV